MAGDAPDDVKSLADLARLLRALRRRDARARSAPPLTYRELAAKVGCSHTTIADYFTAKILPPTDRFDTLVRLLGATPAEQGGYATARDQVEDRRAGAPPAAVARVVPRQLPRGVRHFVGREAELVELDRLLGEAGAIAAIVGTGGVGKTALAVRWAHRVSDRFADGQLYVDLRGFSETAAAGPAEVLAGFLYALGVPAEEIPADVGRAGGLYRTLTADRRLLVLLDNAGNADQVRPLLPGNPGCVVLVTSRDRLSGLVAADGADRIALDGLAADDALVLLGRIAGRERVEAERVAAAALGYRCAHLPLALRIAGASLADHPGRRIVDLLRELTDATGSARLDRLEVTGDGRAAVRGTLRMSYVRLPPASRRLFRLLGLVPGPDHTAESAAALTATPGPAVRVMLDRLVAANLLTGTAPGRYACHDLLRDYALELAQAEETPVGRERAVARIVEHYLHTADAAARLLYPQMVRLPVPAPRAVVAPVAFADPAAALSWLDAERANLVAATGLVAGKRARRAVWLLADTLRGYFWLRAHTVDWLAVAEAGLAAAEAARVLRAQAAASCNLATLAMRTGRYAHAVEHGTRALALARRSRWPSGQATVLGVLGNVYSQSGRLGEAAEAYRESLDLCRRTNHPGGQSASLGNLGRVYWLMGRLEQAAAQHARALEMDRRLGARMNEASSLGDLGVVHHALGRLDEAREFLDTALAIHTELGNRGYTAEAVRVLAAVHRDVGEHARALDLARTALETAVQTGDRHIQADAHNTVASIHRSRGDPRRAIDEYRQALSLTRAIGTRYPEAVALIGLAGAYREAGELGPATAHVQQALAITGPAGYRMLDGEARTELAAIHLDAGRPDRAVTEARAALEIHHDTGYRNGVADTRRMLARAGLPPA